MEGFELLEALHRPNARQGPGSEAATKTAMDLAGLGSSSRLRVADLGCGTGAAALTLARWTDCHITAVDFLAGFIDELDRRAADAGLGGRIRGAVGDIAAPPFAEEELDVIWSEGAIYNLGFQAGLDAWRPLLRPGGILAVSDLTWLSADRPKELTRHWQREYAEVDTAGVKIARLEAAGYDLLGYFLLPPECWLDHYYLPLQARLPAF
jgi:SAM-dependent methyltransferase